MKISVIIVSWNVKEKLKSNLRALLKSRGEFDLEIFVVDNNSVDGSAQMVADNFPQVKLIANKNNLGFAKANNQAIKQSQGDYILLLNPDMLVRVDTIKNLLKWAKENRQAGIIGCKLLDGKEKILPHVRRFPKFFDQAAIILKLPHLFPNILNKYLKKDFDYSRDAQVDSVRGGFFCIKRELIKSIGMLDEKYFLWFEEVDYCRRAKQAGLEVWYTSATVATDYVGQSFKQLGTIPKQRYFRDSMLIYFKKWHPLWQYYLLKGIWFFGLRLGYLGKILKMNSKAKT